MDKLDIVKTEVRLALLERTNKLLSWVAGLLLPVVGGLVSYIVTTSSNEARYETKIEQMDKQITLLTEQLNLTNTDLGAVQTWAEQIFVSKEVFEATKKIK